MRLSKGFVGKDTEGWGVGVFVGSIRTKVVATLVFWLVVALFGVGVELIGWFNEAKGEGSELVDGEGDAEVIAAVESLPLGLGVGELIGSDVPLGSGEG